MAHPHTLIKCQKAQACEYGPAYFSSKPHKHLMSCILKAHENTGDLWFVIQLTFRSVSRSMWWFADYHCKIPNLTRVSDDCPQMIQSAFVCLFVLIWFVRKVMMYLLWSASQTHDVYLGTLHSWCLQFLYLSAVYKNTRFNTVIS